MLSDPLPIKYLDLTAQTPISSLFTANVAVVDVSPGRSVRKGNVYVPSATPGTVTIGHSVSKENRGRKTNRTLIRLDCQVFGTSLDGAGTGEAMNAYAYLVVGIPEGTLYSQSGVFEKQALVQQFLGLICVDTAEDQLSALNLNRILAGEP